MGKKNVKEVHVYHHSDPKNRPFRRDPSNPRTDHQLTAEKLIRTVDKDPVNFIFNFILGWLAK